MRFSSPMCLWRDGSRKKEMRHAEKTVDIKTAKKIPAKPNPKLPEIERMMLSNLRQDDKNARKHNARNIGMIESSLRQVGAARSGVIDEKGVILAGNGTYEALAAAGIDRVKVVEADGNEWVVVRRTGLTKKQKRQLAIADNRSAELAEWDANLLQIQEIDLNAWFNEEELGRLIMAVPNFEPTGQDSQGRLDEKSKVEPDIFPACGFHSWTDHNPHSI